jgi:hypothetical protein
MGDWCVSLSNQHNPKKRQARLGDLLDNYGAKKLTASYALLTGGG